MPFSSNRNSRDDKSKRNRSNSESFGENRRSSNKGSFNSNRDSNRKSDNFRNNDRDQKFGRSDNSSSFNRSDRDNKFGRPEREGGFKKFDRDNRSERPNREGGFKKFDRDNRSERPDREGGFKKFDRDNRSERSNREGGFKKFDRDNRSERPNREGGFKKFDRDNRSERPNREGGFKKFDRDNRSERPDKEGGFKKFYRDSPSDRPDREGGFKKFDRDNRSRDFGDKRRDSRGFGDRDQRSESHDRGERKGPHRVRKAPSERNFKDMEDDGMIRLNRYIANSGICSRRKADELIEAGVISVNGVVVTELGSKVDPAKDEIRYNDERLKREKMVYVLLNKPKDYITTTDDPQERKTVMQLVSKATKERIYPVGRLDRNTTGLLLLTNDGNLAEKLSHPRNNISKIYQVELDKTLSQGDFNKIQFGVELEDGVIKPDDISYVMGASKREVGIQIHSGKNRIVRRIFESLGYDVIKLDRVVYANLTKKDLPRGRWRFLDDKEIIQLKHLMK